MNTAASSPSTPSSTQYGFQFMDTSNIQQHMGGSMAAPAHFEMDSPTSTQASPSSTHTPGAVFGFPTSGFMPVLLQPSSPGEVPIYVNARQYHRIMKRRETRTKFEESRAKLNVLSIKERGYIWESRHKHARTRPRGPNGRFLSISEVNALRDRGLLDLYVSVASEPKTKKEKARICARLQEILDQLQLPASEVELSKNSDNTVKMEMQGMTLEGGVKEGYVDNLVANESGKAGSLVV